jgi:hypothetical protein
LTRGFWAVFEEFILSCVDGGLRVVGKIWGQAIARLVARRGRQFSRFACGFTPACGSEVGVFDAGWFMARLKPCPFEVVASIGLVRWV